MPRACLLLVCLTTTASADEIARRGEAVRGTLALEGGALVFQGEDGKVISSAGLGRVALATTPTTFRDGPPHLAALGGDECVTGVLVGMGKGAVVLRTAWAKRVAIPTAGLVSLTHLPGRRTLVREDFASDPRRLTKADPALAVPVGGKLGAGRIAVRYRKAPTDAKWAVEAEFAGRTVLVAFAGDVPGVDAGGLRGSAYRVKPKDGPHELTLTFSPGSLRIVRDDAAIWYSPDLGPGALKRVRVVRREGAGDVEITGLTVEAAEPTRRPPPGDPNRDELRLASGDQVFGEVKRLDAGGVEIAGAFGNRSYAWKELRGWFPRRTAVDPGKPPKGIAVRLEIRSGLRAERDVLRCILTALDAKGATVHHPRLGELTIPRASLAAVEEVRP